MVLVACFPRVSCLEATMPKLETEGLSTVSDTSRTARWKRTCTLSAPKVNHQLQEEETELS